jgi:hypothetical protein
VRLGHEGYVADFSQHGFNVRKDLLIGEPQDHVILTLEVSAPLVIPGGLLIPIMDLSIKLHDKPAITATEIRDERTDRNLPPKFQIHELPVSQSPPKHLLGRSRALAQSPSQHLIYSHTTSSPERTHILL